MTWTDVTDASDTWADTTDPSYRHTYGIEFGTSSRITLGDNVRYGGGYSPVTDPSGSWSDA